MAPRCYQSLDNGQRCNAPAIHGSRFCRHHDSQRVSLKEPKPKATESEPLNLPPLVDKPSMLAALNIVALALAEGRIKRSVAHTLISAIKLADRLLTEITEAGLSIFPIQAPAAPPAEQTVASLAASRCAQSQPQMNADVICPSNQSSDKFVEQMMEQARELLAARPKPDPAVMRA